jgi:hypothetical protein
MVQERRRVLDSLDALIRTVESINVADRPPSPDLNDECALYFVLMLATTVGPSDHRQALLSSAASEPASPSGSTINAAIRRSKRLAMKKAAAEQSCGIPIDLRRQQMAVLPVDREKAVSAASWTVYLTNHWRRAIAQESVDDQIATAGARLVNIVVSHHRRVIGLRRRTLQSSSEFLHRERDPQQLPLTVTADVKAVKSAAARTRLGRSSKVLTGGK